MRRSHRSKCTASTRMSSAGDRSAARMRRMRRTCLSIAMDTLVADGHTVFLWGVRNDESACRILFAFNCYNVTWSRPRVSQDVHCLHLTTMTWSQILTSGTSPSWRDFHTLSCIDDCLFVFGGRSGVEGPFHTRQEDYDNRVHMLDLKTMTWNTRPAGAGDPIGRRSHSAFVYHKSVYGGFHGADTNLHY